MDAKAVAMERQLYRLENFVDVGYALVVVLIVFNLPAAKNWADQGLETYIQVSLDAIALPALVIVIVLVYWMQNNNLLGKLAATDNVHSSLSILQVFVVLLFLYLQDVMLVFPDEAMPLAVMSGLAVLLGSLAAGSWWYASHQRKLLLPFVGDMEVRKLQLGVLAEPITALITLPFAFVSSLAWNLSWLCYLPVAMLLKRR